MGWALATLYSATFVNDKQRQGQSVKFHFDVSTMIQQGRHEISIAQQSQGQS